MGLKCSLSVGCLGGLVLKSDQNGIEINQIFRRSGAFIENVKIRPKWD